MSNIWSKTITYFTIVTGALSTLLLGVFCFALGLNIPSSFGQEENNSADTTSLTLSGRISSMLTPTMDGTDDDNVMNTSASMSQMMSSDNT